MKKSGIKCFVETNQEKYRGEFIKEIFGYDKSFSQVFISSDIGFKKPEADFFKFVLKYFNNIKLNEILIWDSDEAVVETVKKFGFNAEIFLTFDRFEKLMNNYLSKK